ncbi:hypothetical protein ACJMK2_027464, partial [Sinanodonta woodiana]
RKDAAISSTVDLALKGGAFSVAIIVKKNVVEGVILVRRFVDVVGQIYVKVRAHDLVEAAYVSAVWLEWRMKV